MQYFFYFFVKNESTYIFRHHHNKISFIRYDKKYTYKIILMLSYSLTNIELNFTQSQNEYSKKSTYILMLLQNVL